MVGVFLFVLLVVDATRADENGVTVAANGTDGTRIVNGVDVPVGKYPAQVSIQIQNYHICGGSILNRNTVLTAAHCFDTVKLRENLRVVTGTVDLRKPARRYKVNRVIIHKNYNPEDLLLNDIALLKVVPPFALQGDEDLVTIPKKNQVIPSGSWGSTIGWGLTKPEGNVAQKLQEVDQMLINWKQCSEIIGQIHPTQFCVSHPGLKGICEGDSGGPVYSEGRQVGILSWREGSGKCGEVPAVATMISRYIDWLINNAS